MSNIKSCRIRLCLMLVGLAFIIAYRIMLSIPNAAYGFYKNVIAPIHSCLASFCDLFSFSFGELLIVIFVLAILGYIVFLIVDTVKRKRLVDNLFKLVVTGLMSFCLIYGGFCLLWGVYYASTDINSQVFGIKGDGQNTHEELLLTDIYFVSLANHYSEMVNRDENGCTVINDDHVFEHALNLYDNLEKEYPAIKGNAHKPKRFFFSRMLSYADFTGFFFPFTAEANINCDSPQSMTPSVIAHELAHQRGVAKEDEANFVAVLACLYDGDEEYVYSASLMALVYLQNALYKTGDKDNWKQIANMYSEGVVNDLSQNSRYWEPFRKSISYKATSSTYDAFLKSYNQEKGIETYGGCVDLLIEYYKDKITDFSSDSEPF